MAKLIGSKQSNNFGENFFIEKAQEYLDDECIIYWNRELFGLEFDVAILIPGKGILVVELKGWREDTILRTENSDTIVIRTDTGEERAQPQKQARGYRRAIETRIRSATGKFPLVFQMVGFPQVSKAYYQENRLDVMLEESFTFLKEDFKDNTAFFGKLNQALLIVKEWHRSSFDNRTMLEVRNLFETDVDLSVSDAELISLPEKECVGREAYSYFYYLPCKTVNASEVIQQMVQQYMQGSKLYAVFGSRDFLVQAVHELDNALAVRGLVRKRDSLEMSLEDEVQHTPLVSDTTTAFMGFHCSFSVLRQQLKQDTHFLCIENGDVQTNFSILKELSLYSQFNLEQYMVEHACVDKNVVIRAGAGTGKTHTMISRIAFICYMQQVPLTTMIDRIVMITFTNEAADQMSEKLKAYFKNCYLLSGSVDYLSMMTHMDRMQISTIHSYAKNLIANLGSEFGYGTEVSITSSQYFRRRKVSDLLDIYISQKVMEQGDVYLTRLGKPVYALRDSIVDFIDKLHNKSVDVASISVEAFGHVDAGMQCDALHALLADLIPVVERTYQSELLEDNKIHLSTMMSTLHHFLKNPASEGRIRELRKGKPQFLFVDEFQDCDDTQIETLLTLAQIMEYRMFLVGDIKQCIYRFRGAKEKAFDQLHINDSPSTWLEFSLQRNYRTDAHLLSIFDQSFSLWGASEDELLSYQSHSDRLIGTREYNAYLRRVPDKFYKKCPIHNEDDRIPALISEIRRIQKRLEHERENGISDLPKEQSIAILVRENWQADFVRTECARVGLEIQTNTSGDLYMSDPALDMLTLVQALIYFDEAEYLYSLAISNFFKLDIPKSNLFEQRMKIRKDGWRAKTDEREQINWIIKMMNQLLCNTISEQNTWPLIIRSLRTKPVLQAIRELYKTLQPWQHYSEDRWKQHYYQLNVDLLFEQLINACNVDYMTINSLQEHLYNNIVTKVSVDSRQPPTDTEIVPIECITVHKAKGLEYGHVILPFCSTPMDHIKKSQLHVSTSVVDGTLKIGYSIDMGTGLPAAQNSYYDEPLEKEEKRREEARVLYVAMTRAIRSFSWIESNGNNRIAWQSIINNEVQGYAL